MVKQQINQFQQKGDWWEELGRMVLTTAGDTITIASFTPKKYLLVLFSLIPSGQIAPYLRLNNDANNNYSYRYDYNNGTTGSSVSQAAITFDAGTLAAYYFGEIKILNILNQEKLVDGTASNAGTVGAANAGNRIETVGKWPNTSTQINRIDMLNLGTGDFAVGSEVIVLGHD